MSLAPRKASQSSGFSLTEVLVALAIAVLLVTVLARLIGGTRSNASHIRELIEMTSLSDNLLAELSPQKLRRGQVNGRRAGFAWRLDIAPIDFTVEVQNVKPEKETASPKMGVAAPNAASQGSFKTTEGDQQAPKAAPPPQLIPYRVSVLIKAPSGHTLSADTIRIGPETRDEE